MLDIYPLQNNSIRKCTLKGASADLVYFLFKEVSFVAHLILCILCLCPIVC